MAVVALHVMSYPILTMMSSQNYGKLFVWVTVQFVLTRYAVPCFFMLTGYLSLTKDKNREVKTVCSRVLRIFLAVALICVAHLIINRENYDTPAKLLEALKAILGGTLSRHLWFCYDLMGIYLMFPLLVLFAEHTERSGYRFVLIVTFVFGLLLPTLEGAGFGELYDLVPLRGSSVFYVLLGGYVRKYLDRLDMRIVMAGVLCLIASVYLEYVACLTPWKSQLLFVNPESPLLPPYALLVFMLVRQVFQQQQAAPAWIKSLSDNSFAIYLIHPLYLWRIDTVFRGLFPFSWLLTSLTTFVAAMCVTWLIAALVRKLPLAKKVF